MQTLPNSKFNPLTVILLVQLPCQSARLEQTPTFVFLLDIIAQNSIEQNSRMVYCNLTLLHSSPSLTKHTITAAMGRTVALFPLLQIPSLRVNLRFGTSIFQTYKLTVYTDCFLKNLTFIGALSAQFNCLTPSEHKILVCLFYSVVCKQCTCKQTVLLQTHG